MQEWKLSKNNNYQKKEAVIMIRTTVLITCLSISYTTSVLCSEKSSIAKLFANPDDNDASITNDLQKKVEVIQNADQTYLKKRRLRCVEEYCACSCFTLGCIVTCGCILLPMCEAMDDYCKQLDQRRAQDVAKLNTAQMPSSQTMQ